MVGLDFEDWARTEGNRMQRKHAVAGGGGGGTEEGVSRVKEMPKLTGTGGEYFMRSTADETSLVMICI